MVLSGKYVDEDKESMMWVCFYVIKVCINDDITSMYTDCSGFEDNNSEGFELCCDYALHWRLILLKTSLWAAQGEVWTRGIQGDYVYVLVNIWH